jgi:hypothetical protein
VFESPYRSAKEQVHCSETHNRGGDDSPPANVTVQESRENETPVDAESEKHKLRKIHRDVSLAFRPA